MTQEVLTRITALERFMAPTGRQYGVRPWKVNPALKVIELVDGKPGSVPEFLSGKYTSAKMAEEAIRRFLVEFWNESDKASEKSKKG